jgi:hypothetical protein
MFQRANFPDDKNVYLHVMLQTNAVAVNSKD